MWLAATGRMSARWRPTCGPMRTSSTARSRWTCRASRFAQTCGSAQEVFPVMLEAGRPLYGYVAGGYWEDVGTLEAYLRAHADILDGKVEMDMPGPQVGL